MSTSTLLRAMGISLMAAASAGTATAQVKLGSNPAIQDPSAILELESGSKGLLLPRLTIAQRNAITGPAKGLTIFVTTDSTLEVNIGTPALPLWKRVATTDSAGAQTIAWSLAGNTGINSGQNFLGTTDNKSLRFRTNNTERASIDSNGSMAFGTGRPLTNSGFNIDVTNNNPSYYGSGFRDTGLVVKSNRFGIKVYNNSYAYRGAAIISQPIDGGFGYGVPVIKSAAIYNYNEHGQGDDLSFGIYSHHRIGGGASTGVGIGAYADLGGGGSLKIGLATRADGYAANDHYAIVASGGDVYLGSTNAAMPANPGADSFSVVFGSNNLTTTHLYSTRISGVNNYVSAAGDTIGFKAPASAASITYTLPAAIPTTTNKVLTSTPAGIMGWSDPATFTSAQQGWLLAGNAPAATDFLGTTNTQSLRLRTNNIERVVLDSTGRFNIGNGARNSLLNVGGNISTATGLDGGINVNPTFTDNGSGSGSMIGVRVQPVYNPAGNIQSSIYGIISSAQYPGGSTYLVGTSGIVGTNGNTGQANNYVAGVSGGANNSGNGSTNYSSAGDFQSYNTGAGTITTQIGVRGLASVQTGTNGGSTTNEFGAQGEISHQSGTASIVAGVDAPLSLSGGSITGSAAGVQTNVSFAGVGLIPNAYGFYSRLSFNTGGAGATNAYGAYLGQSFNSGTPTNYRGLYIENIPTGTGIKRVMEYGSTTTPFMIGADASVGVGTLTPSVNAKLAVKDGHIQSQITAAPNASLTVNPGTGRNGTVANATDVAGTITITTGTSAWSGGAQITVSFNKVYATAPVVTLTSAAAGQGGVDAYVTTTTTGFTINFSNAASSSRDYVYNYHVIETQTNNGLVANPGVIIIPIQN